MSFRESKKCKLQKNHEFMFLIFVYRNPPKVSPGLILVQRPFSGGAYIRGGGGITFGGGAYIRGGGITFGGGLIFERRIVLAERDQEL